LSWESVRVNVIPELVEKIKEYDVRLPKAVTKANSLAAVKALCDAYTLYEPVYPAYLPGLGNLTPTLIYNLT